MSSDLRQTVAFEEALAIYGATHRVGAGHISDASELCVSPNGRLAAFAGTIIDKLEGAPPTRICMTDLSSGKTRVLTIGPNTDRLPKFSPDGIQIAFLSDRSSPGDFQLHILEPHTGTVRPTAPSDGWVEYFHWSPDGRRILLGVAGRGADISGGQGAVTTRGRVEPLPAWVPTVNTGDETYRWRHAWIYDLATDRITRVGSIELNVWEAVWCGNDRMAAVVSPGPGEGLWYNARLALVDLHSGETHEVLTPRDQLGWPAASPSGSHLAVVESVCSDRWIVAGNLRLIATNSGETETIDTHGVDISYTEWRSEERLLVAGHRGFQTVVGVFDRVLGTFREVWCSQEISTGGRYVTVSGLGEAGDCALIGESVVRSPEIAVIRDGEYRAIHSFEGGYAEYLKPLDRVQQVTWAAPDGLEIQGWVLLPRGEGPHPLVTSVHGGPVGHWRSTWLGRGSPIVLMLLRRGIALFFPNPRGSAGRGQDFARQVFGDPGGMETADHLSGLDHLVTVGIADPTRLGVMGGSHGGFMSAWLITQSDRFAAAVAVAPVSNYVTQHLISNVPEFVTRLLSDSYRNPNGRYFQRSPIMHAHEVSTPTLSICGALDRCTPPEEAVQFHNALLENGVRSVLVTYPEEGHGVRKLPALFDYSARVVGWFEQHLGRSEDAASTTRTRHLTGCLTDV